MIGKRAQAAMLDAMIFLTVAAIVSISLVSAASNQHSEPNVDLREYVSRAHGVLLRTTVQLEMSRDSNNAWMTVSDLVMSYFLAIDRGEDLDSFEPILEDITQMIEGLTPSWAHFCWTALYGPYELLIGEVSSNSESVWPSSIFSEMPILGGELKFKLEMWS
jgi:hypothetical protein